MTDNTENAQESKGFRHKAHRVRHRVRGHRALGPVYKVVVFLVGIAVVGAGVVMLVVPGPGWAAIILGLVILASEFAWAQRLLDPIKRAADWAAERALDPKKRRQNLALAGLAGLLIASVVVLYLLRYGVTLEPLPFF